MKDPIPLLLLLAVGALLGITANIVKLALAAGWSPLAFLFWAASGAGLLLLALAAVTGNRPAASRQTLIYGLVSGLLSIALPNALAFSAVPHVGAGFVALCLAFPPMLTYLLAVSMAMEVASTRRIQGLLVGLAGAMVLAIGKASGQSGALFWIAAAMAGPLFIAAGNIYRTRYWPAGASALSLAPVMLLGGALVLLPVLLASGSPVYPTATTSSTSYLLLAQIVTFTMTYALYFILQKRAGPVYLSQIGSVGAVFGATVAALLLNEAASLSLVVATLLILFGVLLVNRTPIPK